MEKKEPTIDYSFLKETDIYSPVQKVIEDAVKRISEAKEKLLSDALLQRAKEGKVQGTFDFIKEAKKPFPRIKGFIDHQGNEHFMFNDGSDDGLHLVSFYKDEPSFDINSSRSIGTIGFKYLLCQDRLISF